MAKSRSLVRNETTTAVQSSAKSLRLPADLAQQIDRWTKAMGEDSHSEAMRPLLGNGLSVADRSAPSPIAPVPQSDLRGVVTPKTGTDRLADQRPDGWGVARRMQSDGPVSARRLDGSIRGKERSWRSRRWPGGHTTASRALDDTRRLPPSWRADNIAGD